MNKPKYIKEAIVWNCYVGKNGAWVRISDLNYVEEEDKYYPTFTGTTKMIISEAYPYKDWMEEYIGTDKPLTKDKRFNMFQGDKQLVLIDLYPRLPHGVKGIITYDKSNTTFTVEGIDNNVLHLSNAEECYVEDFKPYLRPMSSMTDEEREEWTDLFMVSITQELEQYTDELEAEKVAPSLFAKSHTLSIDWLNKKGFDYRGLIPMGLALPATEEMYK